MTREWIKFVEFYTGAKTRLWVVFDLKDDELGRVMWHGPWRKYSFFPAVQTVFEQDCLIRIASFLAESTRSHKEKKPTSIPPPTPGNITYFA